MRRTATLLLILLLAVACQRVKSVPKPDGLIPVETMENIIYDMAIINSARGYNNQRFSQTGVKPESHVFEKYEIDSAQYSQSTLYYSSRLDDYKQLIEKVRERVAQEHKIADSIYQEEKRVKDSIAQERAKEAKKEKDSINKAKGKKGVTLPLKVIEVTPPLQ